MDELQIHHNQCHSTNENKLVPLGFQKNYPKNIFIPIIEYLSDLGFREMYQRCVGTRQLFEGKNVVSLAVIHQLLTQKWFIEGVDRANLLAIVCSKILLNSKIKKKIFHLKVAEIVIKSQIVNQKEFKSFISKQVSLLSSSNIQNDQFLDFPNTTIYLFHLMSSVICKQLHSQPCFKHMIKNIKKYKLQDNQQEDQQNQSNLSSKQEFRMYLKLIITLFNDQKYHNNQFTLAYEKIRIFMTEKQAQFSSKYNLSYGVLNSNIFMNQITEKLLQHKQKGLKITNLLLNQLVDNFKTKCVKIGSEQKIRNKINMEQQFTDHQQICVTSTTINTFTPRIFCPHMLILP